MVKTNYLAMICLAGLLCSISCKNSSPNDFEGISTDDSSTPGAAIFNSVETWVKERSKGCLELTHLTITNTKYIKRSDFIRGAIGIDTVLWFSAVLKVDSEMWKEQTNDFICYKGIGAKERLKPTAVLPFPIKRRLPGEILKFTGKAVVIKYPDGSYIAQTKMPLIYDWDQK